MAKVCALWRLRCHVKFTRILNYKTFYYFIKKLKSFYGEILIENNLLVEKLLIEK
jgi:hypothetical protein